MRRRTLVLFVVLSLGILLAPLAAAPQQAAKIARIGALLTGSPSAAQHYMEAFRLGLRELGYAEGQNIVIEYRWAESGGAVELADFAADLVRAKVDLVFAWGGTAATAAKRATSTIPIVFVAVGDPVGIGLVASLGRPGGNITGLTNISAELSAKLLELLKEAVPGIAQVAVLRNPANPVSVPQLKWTQDAAQALRVQLQVVEARDPREFESAFAAMTRGRAGAFIVLADPMLLGHRARIVNLAVKSQLPSIFNVREYVDAGGLMAYGPSLAELFRRVPAYLDKILKGVRPADLPVEQPTKFELVVNLKTAKALGLTIPQSLLVRADHVIQ